MATPTAPTAPGAPAAPTTLPGALPGVSTNAQAAVEGMQQLASDGLALQLADLTLQTTVQPAKKLAGAAKDALS